MATPTGSFVKYLEARVVRVAVDVPELKWRKERDRYCKLSRTRRRKGGVCTEWRALDRDEFYVEGCNQPSD